MSLGHEQEMFTLDIGKLILWTFQHPGWALRGKEWWRPEQMAEIYAESGAGVKDSQHTKSLAWDAMLFIDGEYKTDSESYKPLGDYWKGLNQENRWGGDFRRMVKGKLIVDGNHFERYPK